MIATGHDINFILGQICRPRMKIHLLLSFLFLALSFFLPISSHLISSFPRSIRLSSPLLSSPCSFPFQYSLYLNPNLISSHLISRPSFQKDDTFLSSFSEPKVLAEMPLLWTVQQSLSLSLASLATYISGAFSFCYKG